MGEWKRTRLKHLAAIPITTGVGLPAEHQNPDWPRYIRTTDIAGPQVLRGDVFYSQPPELLEVAGVQSGDLLMTAAGSVGQSYLHTSSEAAVYAGYLARFRPSPDIDPRFVAYWAQSADFWRQIEVGAVRSTIDNFSSGRYRNLELVVPSPDVQTRIADFLDREIQRIDVALGTIENLRDLTNQRLAAQIAEEIGRIAGRAPRVPLKRIVDPARPLTYGIVQAGDDVPGGVPYVRPMDMFEHAGVPDPTALRTTSPEIAQAYQRSTLQAGDVVVSIGPSFGKTMVVPQELAGANLTQGTARVAPAKGFLAEYVQWSLRAPQAIAHWETAVGGATFRALNLEPLGQTPVFMATKADQQAMIQALRATQRDVARLLELTSRLADLLTERRQALITAAVTGQLDVEAVA